MASSPCDRFDRPGASPLGWRRVLTQVCHDLYGTKDVQDAITASYVWMADQIGHLTLGVIPTLLLCWIASLLWHWIGIRSGLTAACIVLALLPFSYWVSKERADYRETAQRAGGVFPFDSADIRWNVVTALLYFGIGGLLGLSPFIRWWLLPVVLVLVLWPALSVAFWWLQRKLAFQQAGLPYLYRLANFSSELDSRLVDIVSALARINNRRVGLVEVMFGRDKPRRVEPILRHLIIIGPLSAGKTSLCVGIGTEFAFSLGRGRYLTATKLAEQVLTDPHGDREYDDGRVLWNWRQCELLIIDDLDAGAMPAGGGADIQLIDPPTFVAALTSVSATPLDFLADRRSVWVLGDSRDLPVWRQAIATLLGLADPGQIGVVELRGSPAPSASGSGRLL